jgi:hypothetical protein
VLESDLRELFERQSATELLPAPISIPAARRTGRARLFRRRAGTFGSPILAAAAVVAVVLAGPFAAAPRPPAPRTGLPAAPKVFDPLTPYAAATWYPYRPSLVNSAGWHTALLLGASSGSRAASTEIVLYAAGWCTLSSARLSCGSTAAGTRAEMTVSGPAPDVHGQPAYWTRFAGGNLDPLRPRAGSTTETVAFQYARGGWAVVESTGTAADVIKVAASLRYGQTSHLRFPFRLAGLPRVWSEVLLAGYVRPGPGAQGPTEAELILGSPATRPGTAPRGALTVVANTQTEQGPRCSTQSVPVGSGQTSTSRPVPCPSMVINGYRVFLNSPPVKGAQTLFAPDADGLYLYEKIINPAGASLSPTAILAHYLHLLGPNAANWTTTPSSGETVKLDHP